jgi:hypothetical protein
VAYGPAEKLVRDHVLVSETSPRELAIEQASCVGLPGGAVIDATGAMVGVVSRGDPQCGASSNWEVATRPDAFAMLIDATLAQGTVSHATHQAKEKKGAIDQGASCETASQCAAGACVTYAGAQYCTRLCDPTDRCPSLTRCMTAAEMTSDIGTDTPSQQSTSVCVAE